jgi:hypothetical protein
MIKKFFVSFLLLVTVASYACTQEKIATTLASILTGGTGKWKVSFAKFGNEEAPNNMYNRFLIEFKNGGTYIATNPDGSIFPSLLPNGVWKEETGNKILFDGSISVREISQQRTANKIVLEWEVSIHGKVTTTYRIELVKAN